MKAITIPYAYILRNIVESELLLDFDILFVYDELEAKRIIKNSKLNYQGLILPLKSIPSFSLGAVLFKFLSIGIQEILSTRSYFLKKKFNRVTKYNVIINFLAKKLFLAYENSSIFQKFIDNLCFNSAKVKEQIKKNKVSKIYVTCHHFRHEYYYIAACQQRNMEIQGIIYSWDVITTKGNYLKNIPKLNVWGSVSTRELNDLHRGKLNRSFSVKEIGMLQNSKNYPSAKIERDFLYTASLKRLFKNEETFINNLCNAAKKNNFKLAIRVHPQEDDLERFSTVMRRHRDVKFFITGKKSVKSLDQVEIENDFFKKYMHQISSSRVIIGVASTTALDAIKRDKPYIFIGFDNVNKFEDGKIKSFYEYEHYKKLIDLTESEIIESYQQLENSMIKMSEIDNFQYSKQVKQSYGL